MKKRLNAKEARKFLKKVPNEVSFWLCTNHYIRSLKELSNSLDNISDDTFRYHVTKDKNDFEVWIRQSIKDKELSREISRIKTKETLARKIAERFEELSQIVKISYKKKKKGKKILKRKKKKRIKRPEKRKRTKLKRKKRKRR